MTASIGAGGGHGRAAAGGDVRLPTAAGGDLADGRLHCGAAQVMAFLQLLATNSAFNLGDGLGRLLVELFLYLRQLSLHSTPR